MKVLHVITGLNVGGAETMLARLLENAQPTPDIRSEVVTLIPPGFVGQRIVRTGTPVHTVGMTAGRPSLGALYRLASLVRAIRPDLVMGWMHHGQIAATLAARLCSPSPALVWNVRHSLDGYREEKPMSRAMLRIGAWLSGVPQAIVYNSRAASRQYRAFGYRPRVDRVIPNGFDLAAAPDRFASRGRVRSLFSIAEEALLIGMIARNHPMKDVGNLVAAFARTVAARPDAHLLIVGEGMDVPAEPVRKALDALPAASWTLSGHRSDVGEWLPGLDILALPSAWGEGFPNILGEAMAGGVACVATDVGDSAWIIGDAGRVVQPRDPEALADALLGLAALGPAQRAALGNAARRRIAANFTIERIAADYADLYRAALHPSIAAATPAAHLQSAR